MRARTLPSNALDPVLHSDLRRKREARVADVILDRAALLLPSDKALLTAVYRDGVPASRLAAAHGAPARTIRRRIRALVQRVLSPGFEFVMRSRDQWPPTRRRVATACVIHGRSLRDAARHLGISLHLVRRHMESVRLLEDAQRAAQSAPASHAA